MARVNSPFLSFNRGLVSPKALARVDLDRTRLSAEVFTNWLPKTQGAMTIRPGTKYFGSSLNDSGAYFIEFVSSVDDVALLELTDGKMRVWLGDDAHDLELLERPPVDTRVSLTDTGWSNTSTGGHGGTSIVDYLPTMTAATTGGVTVTASSELNADAAAFHAADDDISTSWVAGSAVPQWVKFDFGAGHTRRIKYYTVAFPSGGNPANAPNSWTLESNDVDTGTGWTVEDTRVGESGWGLSEKRTYQDTGYTDTGANARRFWRLNISSINGAGSGRPVVGEVELQNDSGGSQVSFTAQGLLENASGIGALARVEKRVILSDTGTEHSLAITVARGPVTLRVGSSRRDDDYIRETELGTGYHNLAFTPLVNFFITLQTEAAVDRIVSSLTIGDSGTVEIISPWSANDLDNVRFDQSADVVYVSIDDVRGTKIERRGTGRSFSVVDYAPKNGPFLPVASTSAKLSVSHFFGNTALNSDIPFFTLNHVGALIRLFHEGQGGQWRLGARDAKTDAIEVTGISDTGTETNTSERAINFAATVPTGTWSGNVVIERSVDGNDRGFKPVSDNLAGTANYAGDTGSFTRTITDQDDNIKVWYRARVKSYNSGSILINATYKGGGVTGIGRVTGYNSNTDVDIEVISRFSDTGPTDNWQQGYWSNARGFPSAVALHGGRLAHAQGGSLFLTVADDYENYDDTTIGDKGPIIRTLGSGPVNSIHYLISTLRLLIGTAGEELALTSSSLDEPVTPDNSNARGVSTQGAANVRSVKLDNRAIMVQRSKQRVFMLGPGAQGSTLGDYEAAELTLFVPDLLAAGVVSIAIQRQPDTRLHCVLADGTVGILTYEPQEEVICWSMWETDGAVERAMVLPGVKEDAVYYHIRRTIGQSNDTYTKVLLHFDGADASTVITDDNAGGSARVWTANGNAQIDMAQSKFGGASALFDGTGDYITTPDHADFVLGSSDFTVDFWFNCTLASAAYGAAAGQNDASVTAAATSFLCDRDITNKIRGLVSNGSAITTLNSTTLFTDAANTGWHHYALVRNGNTLTLYLDGVAEATSSFTGTVPNVTDVLGVGTRGATTNLPWKGWIDEFRLSVGIARWTANFTPPTRAYGHDHVRYLEKWAMESECLGDTGLSYIVDCAVGFTDTGRASSLTGFPHLAGRRVAVWANDTGQTKAGKDLSPGYGDDQVLYTVDTGLGTIALAESVHHAVAGLPYQADWRSTKLAYGAQAGTGLSQMHRAAQIAFVLYRTHNRGLLFGSDTGELDPLPKMIDEGAAVDRDKIFATFDQVSMAIEGRHNPDARIHLRASAPRPCTVLAAVPSVQTNEKV